MENPKQQNHSMRTAIGKKIKIPPIAYPYTGQERLVVKKDIVYTVADGTKQSLDIYYPQAFTPLSAPTVLFVNGGGPIRQNHKEYPCFTSWGELAALNRIVGIVFNWRAGKYGDVDAMLTYLFENANELGVDTDRICVFPLCRGVSGTLKSVLKFPVIKRMVMYYGKVGKGISIQNRNDMSFLIVMSQNDSIYEPSCNDWFIEKAIATGNSAYKIVHPSGVHGFDFINDDEITRSIIDDTISFIKTCKVEPRPST